VLFLVGSPRSGTTWLQAMLSSHRSIYTGPETFFFSTFAEAEKEYLRPKERRIGLAEYLGKDDFYRLIREVFWFSISALPEPAAETKYFLEKTTNHCMCAEFILRTFPKARFIHIIRDPRAVVASILRASKSWGKTWAPQTARDATKMWSRVFLSGKRIKDLVANPDQYVEVRYEDLRTDPSRHLSSLFHWLGVETCAKVIGDIIELNALEKMKGQDEQFPSIPVTASSAVIPVAETPYPEGFFGPAPVRAEAIELSLLQRATVENLVGDLLADCGYRKANTVAFCGELIRIIAAIMSKFESVCRAS
jgi:sulfotransferase family protein